MAFFTLQGPLLLAEAWLARLRRQAGLRLPHAVHVAATVAVLHLCEFRGGAAYVAVTGHPAVMRRRGFCGRAQPCTLSLSHGLGPHMAAVAQALFFPDIVAEGLPRRLLHQLLPGGICHPPPA